MKNSNKFSIWLIIFLLFITSISYATVFHTTHFPFQKMNVGTENWLDRLNENWDLADLLIWQLTTNNGTVEVPMIYPDSGIPRSLGNAWSNSLRLDSNATDDNGSPTTAFMKQWVATHLTAISNSPYSIYWNGVNSIAPSKNVIFDKIETLPQSNYYYVTTRAHAGLTNGVNLGALTTGLLKNTVIDGVATLSRAIPDEDYLITIPPTSNSNEIWIDDYGPAGSGGNDTPYVRAAYNAVANGNNWWEPGGKINFNSTKTYKFNLTITDNSIEMDGRGSKWIPADTTIPVIYIVHPADNNATYVQNTRLHDFTMDGNSLGEVGIHVGPRAYQTQIYNARIANFNTSCVDVGNATIANAGAWTMYTFFNNVQVNAWNGDAVRSLGHHTTTYWDNFNISSGIVTEKYAVRGVQDFTFSNGYFNTNVNNSGLLFTYGDNDTIAPTHMTNVNLETNCGGDCPWVGQNDPLSNQNWSQRISGSFYSNGYWKNMHGQEYPMYNYSRDFFYRPWLDTPIITGDGIQFRQKYCKGDCDTGRYASMMLNQTGTSFDISVGNDTVTSIDTTARWFGIYGLYNNTPLKIFNSYIWKHPSLNTLRINYTGLGSSVTDGEVIVTANKLGEVYPEDFGSTIGDATTAWELAITALGGGLVSSRCKLQLLQ